MEYWDIWQPKLTYVLKNTDEAQFHQLAAVFSEIVGVGVKVSIVKDKERWMLFYNPVREGSFRFYFSLHDPTAEEYLTSDFEIDRPTIQIHDLFITPTGQGLGTKVLFAFLEKMQDTDYEQIVLRAESERAARFWRRFGFHYKEDTSLDMPSMSLDLYPLKGKRPAVVKIKYKQQ
jgi:GNAT superfamily N-acetyltransferase